MEGVRTKLTSRERSNVPGSFLFFEYAVLMNEKLGGVILIAGIACLAIGALWLLLRAFSRGFWRDLFAPLLMFLKPSKGLYPTLLILLGGLLLASPWIIKAIAGPLVDTTAKITENDAGTTLTLTGAKPEDAEKIREITNLTKLQWSDPAVTDAQLEWIKDKNTLVELDLNGAQITDEGLKILATLPRLKSLRLARTKITDEGFRTHLLPLQNLDELDLTGTAVKVQTLREWVKLKEGRKRPSL
jgi:hypothetical protein